MLVIDGTKINDLDIYDFLPNLIFTSDSSNNILKILSHSDNGTFNYDASLASAPFSLQFTNANKTYKVPYTNLNITNLVFFVYNLNNETVSLVETSNNDLDMQPNCNKPMRWAESSSELFKKGN